MPPVLSLLLKLQSPVRSVFYEKCSTVYSTEQTDGQFLLFYGDKRRGSETEAKKA
jgi:hypothetical protein